MFSRIITFIDTERKTDRDEQTIERSMKCDFNGFVNVLIFWSTFTLYTSIIGTFCRGVTTNGRTVCFQAIRYEAIWKKPAVRGVVESKIGIFRRLVDGDAILRAGQPSRRASVRRARTHDFITYFEYVLRVVHVLHDRMNTETLRACSKLFSASLVNIILLYLL